MTRLVAPIAARLAGLPGTRGALRGWLRRRAQQLVARYPAPLRTFLGDLFVVGSMHNVPGQNPKVRHDFQFAIRNPSVAQALTGIEVVLDGRAVRRERVWINRKRPPYAPLDFSPDQPLPITLAERGLPDGIHFVGLRLHGTVTTLNVPPTPLRMHDGQGELLGRVSPELALPTAARVVHFVPFLLDQAPAPLAAEARNALAAGHLADVIRWLDATPQATYSLGALQPLRALADADPAALDRLRSLVKERRAELLCSGVVEPGLSWLRGESIIRQVTSWQTAVRRMLDPTSAVAWLPTVPSACASLPQILLKAGCRALALSAGRNSDAPADFMWEGIDGTRIKTHRLRVAPSWGYPWPRERDAAATKLHGVLRHETDLADGLLPAGSPFGRPQTLAPADFAAPANTTVHYSLPSRFFATRPDRGLPVVTGDLGWPNAGDAAARPRLRRLHCLAETAVLDLERLPLILGAPPDDTYRDAVREAWALLLPEQHHAVLTGRVDEAAAETAAYRLRRVSELVDQTGRRLPAELAARVPAPGDAVAAMVAVNTLPFWRDKLVPVDLPATDGALPMVFDGKYRIPLQIARRENFADGQLRRGHALFRLAVPPLGYRVVWLCANRPDAPRTPERAVVTLRDHVLENGWLTVSFNAETGTVARIVDRHRERVFDLTGGGLLVTRPSLGKAVEFTTNGVEVLETGPLRAALRFTGKVGRARASITYRLAQTSKVVEVEIEIDGAPAQGGFGVRFPRWRGVRRVVQEIPYGHVAREPGHYAAQTYLDLDATDHGLALLTGEMAGCEIAKGHVELTVAGSLAHRHWLDPTPVPLPDRLRAGYGIYPHEHGTGPAALFRRGLDLATPLWIGREALSTHGVDAKTPRAHGLIQLSPDTIELGALYADDDGSLVARLIERGGKDTLATLKLSDRPARVELTDLLGHTVREVRPGRWHKTKGAFDLRFRAFEIKTLRIFPRA